MCFNKQFPVCQPKVPRQLRHRVRHIIRVSKKVLESTTIRGGDRRNIPFNDIVAAALEDYLPDRDRLARPDCDALFVSERGTPLSVRALQYLIGRYASLAGIPVRMSPHDLRHGGMTAMGNAGAPVRFVQEQAGQKDIRTTQRYMHVTDAERYEAVNSVQLSYRRAARQRARRLRRRTTKAARLA